VSAKPLVLGAPAPTAPLGSWTLLRDDLVLAAAHCSSPFPNGEAHFEEDRTGPPSRAYLKLAEALTRLGRHPAAGDRCLDLGASPGGWTWYLAGLGARVEAVDKAPLADTVMAQRGVHWRAESAFAIDPERHEPVDWVCSDVIAYPERLLGLVERWIASGRTKNIVCTVKFQGPTDHAVAARFAALPDGRLQHLHHNRHELTFTWPDRPATLG
jgi:23S rRNA (cytidine2498-2'-O)-methyltransferase